MIDHNDARWITMPLDGESVSVNERVVVSPITGRFEMAPPQNYTAEGEYILEGQTVGYVNIDKQRTVVAATFSGWVMGFLVNDGQPVSKGQPILWLRRL